LHDQRAEAEDGRQRDGHGRPRARDHAFVAGFAGCAHDLGQAAQQVQPQSSDRQAEPQRRDAVAEFVGEHAQAEEDGEERGEQKADARWRAGCQIVDERRVEGHHDRRADPPRRREDDRDARHPEEQQAALSFTDPRGHG
jgi:hypothetical protein